MLPYMILMSSFPHLRRKKLENHNTFFMTSILYNSLEEYAANHDQIFRSPINHTMASISFALLCIPPKLNTGIHTLLAGDNTTLASQSNTFGRFHIGNSNNFPKCKHCHHIGHTIDKCWKLHRNPLVQSILPRLLVLSHMFLLYYLASYNFNNK